MITVKMINHKSDNVFDLSGRADGVRFFKDISKDGKILDPVEIFKGVFPTMEKNESEDEDGPISFKMILSDSSLDRDEERINVAGWQLGRYKQNPVLLWGHDHSRPAIGTVTNLSLGDSLSGIVTFAEKRVDHFAWSIGQKMASGILKAGSVGFYPTEWKFIDDPEDPAWVEFEKQDLLEFSIVNVPSNPNALVEDAVADYPFKQLETLNEKLQELTNLIKGDHTVERETKSKGISLESVAEAVASAVQRNRRQ